MIQDITLFIVLLVSAIGLSMGLSILVHVVLRRGNLQASGAFEFFGKTAKMIAFALFLVIGFSVVPIMVKFFTEQLRIIITNSSLVETIQSNAMNIVYGFWIIYVAGMIIALPQMIKSGFFESELLQKNPSGKPLSSEAAKALPPLDYQINAAALIVLATTNIENEVITYIVCDIWKQTEPQQGFSIGIDAVVDITTWKLLGYEPKHGEQVVLFFLKDQLKTRQPLELLPVQEDHVLYGSSDPSVQKSLSLQELKDKIQT